MSNHLNKDIQVIDVSDGKPQTLKLSKETKILAKGIHVSEKEFILTSGTYVINEVIKNIFISNRGKYEKVGTQHFLIAEKTSWANSGERRSTLIEM